MIHMNWLKMKRNYIILFVILFYTCNYALASPETNDIHCLEDFSNLEPAFSLVTRNEVPMIDKGGVIEFEIFITGYGNVTNPSKLYVAFPIGLVELNTIYGSITYFNESIANNGQIMKNTFLLDSNDSDSGFSIIFPSYFYQQRIKKSDCYEPNVLAEMSYINSKDVIRPISVKINTSNNAPEGDNKIELVLTYSDGNKWHQSKEEVKFHIKSLFDKIFPILQYIGVVAAFIAIIAALVTVVLYLVKKRLKNRSYDGEY